MTVSKRSKYPSRHSACQGRSGRTRQRLIEVAAEVFSIMGYKSANTRIIVERAKVNLAAIPYYFGSKRELYKAAAEFIGSDISDRLRPACDRAREGFLNTGLTHKELLSMFTEFIVEIAHVMLGADTTNLWGQFILTPEAVHEQAIHTGSGNNVLWH
jgi:TetR/AcrR family transcriptional regulator, regulator of cefoperazone and chloramphenicol sensitivity